MSENAQNVEIIEPDKSNKAKGKGKQELTAVSDAPPLTPMAMLDRALSEGKPLELVEKLMALQERWERNEARKAFDDAIASAKAEMPVIVKNRRVGFDSKKQGAARTDYRHEDLGEIARTIDPILGKYGLSYRFQTTSLPNEPISVTCIVSHRLGHSERNTLSAGRDESGNKNHIQSIGSAITYLQRYTLKAALGLAAANDDDGRAAGGAVEDDGPINDEQREKIQSFIVEHNFKIRPFCNVMKVDSVANIPASRFAEAMKLLQDKADEEDRVAGKKP